MKVVILCGGQGTRIRELTDEIPKPMIQIGEKPILWHIMKIFEKRGFNDFILCTGYKKEKIEDYFKEHPEKNMKIQCVYTGEGEVPKSERLKKIKDLIDGDEFFLAYGDDVSDVNVNDVLEKHKKMGNLVTMTIVNPSSNFGVIKVSEDHKVIDFVEKPVIEDMWINGGFAVLNKKIFEHLDKGELENEVYRALAKTNDIGVHKHSGFWQGMNTFKDRKELGMLWEKKEAPWKVWDDE